MHPLTLLIRSIVLPPGTIENLWENTLPQKYFGYLCPESDQIKNLKATHRRVQMLRIS